MKKVIATAALLLATLVPAAQAAQKIAVVNTQAIMAQHPEREAVGQRLESEFGERIAEVQKLQADLQELAQKMQKDAALMTDAQKTELERKGQSLQADLQLKGKALQEDTQQRESEEMNKIVASVQSAINAVAQEQGYDIVLEARAVVFAKDEDNISAQVLEKVSKGN